jgi:hypothetical protein
MATIEDVAVNVLLEAPECPSTVAQHAVLRAARDLCQRARVWRVTVPITWDATGLVDITALLSLVPANQTDYMPELIDVISMTSNDLAWPRPLRAKTSAQMDRLDSEWRANTATNPEFFVPYTGVVGGETDLNVAGKFILSPLPTAGYLRNAISNITSANTGVITTTTHGLSVGDRIRIRDTSDMASNWPFVDGLVQVCASPTSGTTITMTYSTAGFASYSEVGLSPYVEKIGGDARCAVKPANTATDLSDALLRFHEETIICGAVSYALRMSNTPWTNLDSATFHKEQYEALLMKATIEADDENLVGPRRINRYERERKD